MDIVTFARMIDSLCKAITDFNNEVTRKDARAADVEYYRGRLMAIKDAIESAENVSIIFVHKSVNDFYSPIMDYEMYELD